MSLTEEMVYELNRSGSHGYGLDGGYNYGNESFMNMESWKMDKAGNQRFKVGQLQLEIGRKKCLKVRQKLGTRKNLKM